jgi:hypothetical protein
MNRPCSTNIICEKYIKYLVGAPEEKRTLRRLRCKRDDNNKVEEIELKK